MDNNSDGRNDIKTHARVTSLTEFSSKWWDTANIFYKLKSTNAMQLHIHIITM